MKKLFVLTVLLLTSGIIAQAQVFTLGVKGGVSSSNVDFENPTANFSQYKEKGTITGYHAGVFTRLNVLGFILQPEAVLSKSGGTFEVPDKFGETSIKEMGFTNLDVPLLVGYKLLFLRAYAGPVASVLIDSNSDLEDYRKSFSTTDWGYQVGAGFDISRLTADVRYERLNRAYNDANGSADIRNQQVILSLGYKLFGK